MMMDFATIPTGFEPCHTGTEPTARPLSCPACKSPLVKKIAINEEHDDDSVAQAASRIKARIKADKHAAAADERDDEHAALASSLESARCANLLLQAMSFDAATREQKKDMVNPIAGVSFCYRCKVHVITDTEELTTLFDSVAIDNDEDAIEECLKGRLLVAVDDKEVDAVTALDAHRKELAEEANQFDGRANGVVVPTNARDFDYEYRHKIATKVIGGKIGRGYKLSEELCTECEMPLMTPPADGEEEDASAEGDKERGEVVCVVCPKLQKKMTKFAAAKIASKSTEDTNNNEVEDVQENNDPSDPVEAIIAEARKAGRTTNSAAGEDMRRRVAEAKMFLNRRAQASVATLTPTSSQAADGAETPNKLAVDWDELLTKGRTLLSDRLKEGWTITKDNCIGLHCKNTPLLSKDGEPTTCTVCGGCGDGLDGAYALDVNSQQQQQQAAIFEWDDLVTNGRAILTERLKQGWIMSSENCAGVNCKGTPLTGYQGGPSSCVVCGGSGSGFDGAYTALKSEEVIAAERELVTQEISYLMTMGWVLRDSLCDTCQMPLIAEHVNSVDMCILCGENPLSASLPPTCFDDNANTARQLMTMGWMLPEDAPLCRNCGGIQMCPPHSSQIGCINSVCPMASPAVFKSPFLPTLEQKDRVMPPSPPMKTEPPPQHSKGISVMGRFIKEGLPTVVCGSSQNSYADDSSALSDDMSQVRSVASSALGAILVRLDNAKYQLETLRESGDADPEECAKKSAEIATLIEKLASAAVAMKQMEDVE